MGRSVLTHPQAEVTAYVDWEEGYTSMCFYCDEEVTFDGENYLIEGTDVPEHCHVHYSELMTGPNSDIYYAMDNAKHEGHQYDSDNWSSDLECTADYMKELWPSLWDTESWPSNEVRVFLENNLVEISVSEYGGLTALCIAVKESAYDEGKQGLARSWIKKVAPKFLSTFGRVEKMGTFSNGESVYKKAEV